MTEAKKRQIARRQPRRITIKFKNFFIVSARSSRNFLLVREPKRAFACSVSSNGIICSRLAVKSVFLSFLCPLPAAFVKLRLVMVICAIPAILTMIRHSLIGFCFRVWFSILGACLGRSFALMESCGHQQMPFFGFVNFQSWLNVLLPSYWLFLSPAHVGFTQRCTPTEEKTVNFVGFLVVCLALCKLMLLRSIQRRPMPSPKKDSFSSREMPQKCGKLCEKRETADEEFIFFLPSWKFFFRLEVCVLSSYNSIT